MAIVASTILLTAGCSGAISVPNGPGRTPTPRPTPPVVTIPPETLPTPGTSPVGPRRSPTAREAALIEAFITRFARADVPFHVAADGVVHGLAGSGSADAGISVEGDVVGDDFDGHVALAGTGKVRVRVVDGVGYGHMANGEWTVIPSIQQAQPLNPFSTVAASDVEYVGEAPGRRSLHRLRVWKWVGGDVNAGEVRDARVVSSVLDIHVTDAGMPVKAILTFTVAGRIAALETRLDYNVVYRFSNVGDEVTIEAPRL